jgi:hypothetical protein
MIVFTVDEIQDEGLALVGLNLAPQERGGIKRNARRFMENFGSSPAACAVIWHDLQSTSIPAARISPKSAKEVRKFLLSMYYLYNYPKEKRIPGAVKVCDRTAREAAWKYAVKIHLNNTSNTL